MNKKEGDNLQRLLTAERIARGLDGDICGIHNGVHLANEGVQSFHLQFTSSEENNIHLFGEVGVRNFPLHLLVELHPRLLLSIHCFIHEIRLYWEV